MTVSMRAGLGIAIWIVGVVHASASAWDVERLTEASGGTARVAMHRATGVARFVSVDPGRLSLEGTDAVARAEDFFSTYGLLFGITDPATQLGEHVLHVDRLGATHLSYRQLHEGVPVFAGMLRVHFDPQGSFAAANGTFLPDIELDPRPVRSAEEASRVALRDVVGRSATSQEPPVAVRKIRLVVYRTGLLQRVAGRDHLAWEVEVGNGHDVRELRFVDARTGKVVDRIGGIHRVIDRVVHEGQLDDVVIWSEGDPLPYDTGDAANDDQVNGLIHFAEDVYDLFLVLSGGSFPSWDGLDGTMHSVWKTTSLSCPNASWNGTSTNFCDGVASDDIVSHEWTHAYTERTHGLIYAWQPGALNESYSDIYGEVVDTINGEGTDTPAVQRTVGDCSQFGGSPPPALEVLTPGGIAGDYGVAGANFNPSPPVAVTATVELVDDGSGTATDACESPVGFTSGRIAMIDRGNCSFASKTKRAQDAGAVGVIIVNNADSVFTMGGSDPSIVIPAVMVKSSDGQTIGDQLVGGVTADIELAEADAPSLRWLNGEDSAGFGGAIRDLWNPVCFGDPGRVTDAQYQCSTGDGGGVHTNSGVPNHGFALLVDGGTYNGQTVSGIGLTKAAHLYWRTMSVYQVPDTDFADHRDALVQSCTDLLGVDLADLTSGASTGQMLTTADCEQVNAATLAVEMAADPPCDFGPLLDPDAPPFDCGAVAFADDFEEDPTGSWTLTNQGVYAEYDPRDWQWSSDLPEGGSGSAFFALDSLTVGNCIEGDDDQSGVMFLESPPIVLGGEGSLVFDHWVATEPGYDGGNLKISVNGGAFEPVIADDFVFNRYNASLETAENGNTNPLAGEEAFTGTDGGEVGGSWGQSQVDLSSYADAGDTIRLRFDFGVDGCNGNTGWYVDDVVVCTAENGAGRVPDGAGVPGTPLTVDRSGADVTLTWGASCVAGDSDYEVYEGTLGSFDSHTPRVCSTAGATTTSFSPAAGDSYYLVVPASVDREGSYGTDGAGGERPPGNGACLPQALAIGCD